MTQTEALKLALEASKDLCNEFALEKVQEILSQAIEQAQKQEPSYWLGFGLQAHTEKPFDEATPLYTSPPQRKPPEPGDGSGLFYEAVRLLDNAIFAQSGDVVRHQSAAHKEAVDFFNHVFTRLDLTPSPQRKPLTDEQYFEIGQRHWLPSNKVEQIHKEIEEASHGIKGEA